MPISELEEFMRFRLGSKYAACISAICSSAASAYDRASAVLSHIQAVGANEKINTSLSPSIAHKIQEMFSMQKIEQPFRRAGVTEHVAHVLAGKRKFK
jgi:hypothetical protein